MWGCSDDFEPSTSISNRPHELLQQFLPAFSSPRFPSLGPPLRCRRGVRTFTSHWIPPPNHHRKEVLCSWARDGCRPRYAG